MMSRHFALNSELTGVIVKILPHGKNQLSAPGSFFNQFVTDIYIYIYIYICNELIEETAGRKKLIFGMWECFGNGSSQF